MTLKTEYERLREQLELDPLIRQLKGKTASEIAVLMAVDGKANEIQQKAHQLANLMSAGVARYTRRVSGWGMPTKKN